MSRESFLEKIVSNIKNIESISSAYIKKLSYASVITALATGSGCSLLDPASRFGTYATPTMRTVYIGLEDLGEHGTAFEGRGIVYTNRAGHIDITHARITADWTISLAKKTHMHLMKNDKEFSFNYDNSLFHIEFAYPKGWKEIPEKEKNYIADEISNVLGQHFAYTASTWHEITTWFGYQSTAIFPEFHSSFSWEDEYSNIFGCHVGALALKSKKNPINKSVTLKLEEELKKFGIREKKIAEQAAERVKGKWWRDDILAFGFVNMIKRNFDIGLDDGFVSPWIVPMRESNGAEAADLPVPNLNVLEEYGFSMNFSVEPRIAERNRILKIIYPDKKQREKYIIPKIHFPLIMKYIKNEAVKMYGINVDNPEN